MKKMIYGILLIGMAGMSLIGCGLLPKEEEYPAGPVLAEAETEEYRMVQVERRDLQAVDEIRVSYTASAAERYGFKIGGEVIGTVYVKVGDEVKTGDVLAELDISEEKEQIRQQQEQLDSLEMELKHLTESEELALDEAKVQDQQAAENGAQDWNSQQAAVSAQYAQERQLIQNRIELAEMKLEKAQRDMEVRQIIAVADGTVTDLYEFKEGEKVFKGKNVITVSDISSARFEVYSENKMLLKEGESYTIVCGQMEYEGIARYEEAASAETESEVSDEEDTNSVVVYLEPVTLNLDLETGTAGTIRLVREESQNTLCVPKDVVYAGDDGYIVYTVDEFGFREICMVEIGISDGSMIEIVSGLTENDLVILD